MSGTALKEATQGQLPDPPKSQRPTVGWLWHLMESFRQPAIVTSLGSFIALGLPAGALGVAWPAMRVSFGAPLAGLGILLALFTTGYFISGAIAGWLMRSRHPSRLLVEEAILTAAGLALLAATSEWLMAICATVLIGLGSGAVNGTINAHAAAEGGPGRLGALHGLWALGAALGPIVVLVSLGLTGSWRLAYAWMATVFLALAAAAYWKRHSWVWQPSVVPVRRESTTLGNSAFVWWIAPAFFYVGLEASVGHWSFTELSGISWLPNNLIGGYVTLFWLALMSGRIVLAFTGAARWLDQFQARSRLTDWSVVIAAFGTVGFLALPDGLTAVVPLLLVGIGLSTVVPLQFKGALDRAAGDARAAAMIVSYQCAAGTLGYAILPAVIGLSMQWFGLATLKPMLVLIGAGMITTHFSARCHDKGIS